MGFNELWKLVNYPLCKSHATFKYDKKAILFIIDEHVRHDYSKMIEDVLQELN